MAWTVLLNAGYPAETCMSTWCPCNTVHTSLLLNRSSSAASSMHSVASALRGHPELVLEIAHSIRFFATENPRSQHKHSTGSTKFAAPVP